MNTSALKNFAQATRRQLLAQVEARLEQVMSTDSAALREKLGVINELRSQLEQKGRQSLIEEVAYTWFNRLCALRYMDVNHYTRSGVVSPAEGFSQPEILQNAKQGIFDPAWQINQARVQGLLSGRITALNADQEAYRMLLVAVCNSYAREMGFLFEAIEDYSELLMPEDLLSSESILAYVRAALTAETCQDVEVIGWLYQFYISEKKDQVMAAEGAVKKEDIPAVTQLFTPDWIVRYMVQNTLGRLWLLNHPQSAIRSQMEYYIPPSEVESDCLKVSSPEELKVLDPACGSGHILTYAFDLLYAIYEEAGYDPLSIPQLILQKNLYGIEIDRRAAMLASFALMMKARSKDKRFFRRGVQPNILEMEDIHFTPQEVKAYLEKVGQDLWTQDLWQGLQQFENAKTFGSLIRPVIKDVAYLRKRMQEAGVFEDLFLSRTNEKLLKVLEMAEYLSPRYQVVVANPPYLSKGMDGDYKKFAQNFYPDSKLDALTMFIERNVELASPSGYVGMVTIMSWMFLKSFGKLRSKLLDKYAILNMAHLGANAFDTIGGEVVSTTMFVLHRNHQIDQKGGYFRLVDGNSELEKAKMLTIAIEDPDCGWFYTASADDFKKIPGEPIAYWVSSAFINSFSKNPKLEDLLIAKTGVTTGDNDKYVLFWTEVALNAIKFDTKSRHETNQCIQQWYPLNSGGQFRKWFGNLENIIDWQNDGQRVRSSSNSNIRNQDFFFCGGLTWSKITSSKLSVRYSPSGCMFDAVGLMAFPKAELVYTILGILNSKIASMYSKVINPTLSILIGDLNRIPLVHIPKKDNIVLENNVERLVHQSLMDWNSFETSWDFKNLPILHTEYFPLHILFSNQYANLRVEWQSITDETKKLEEQNNYILLETYGLQDELTPEVPLEEITLTCNPNYRYRGNYTEAELEARLLEDTMKEFLSYAVGCMFGRYSLDKPGLILANQGESLEDYLRIIGKEPTFTPSASNVIPILDGDWFADDITARFKQFLRVTFSEQHYDENLRFIENALGKELRRYFLKDFYKDHVQMYKKRPIYWLFSSPKGSFNALVYMHRYRSDTVSVVLNQYLRPYREKLNAQRRLLENTSTDTGASAREKARAVKEIEALSKVLAELKQYEDEVLYPLAAQKIEIDLDDGVKVNYAKFGEALRKI